MLWETSRGGYKVLHEGSSVWWEPCAFRLNECQYSSWYIVLHVVSCFWRWYHLEKLGKGYSGSLYFLNSARNLWVYNCVCVFSVVLSCLTVCNPMAWDLPGSSVHGTFPARILKQAVNVYSRGSSGCRNWTRISCVRSSLHQVPPGKPGVYNSFLVNVFKKSKENYLKPLWLL